MHPAVAPPPSPPELLAPAGDWDCLRAAIENGADAVYFGLDAGFNARARATNFAVGDLPELMDTLHRRGLRGYATLNTLVFADELEPFGRLVEDVADAGVDAVLVQDVGVAAWIRGRRPDLPLHASTQMTLTSAETIELAERLGMSRVVLARELSIAEIAAIRRQTSMPLEVFVHGALCVAYSGQCLTSESLGGRSANRGQCAQACRLPYDLVCDGRDVNLGDRKYLLSPQDLAAYALAPELLAAGIAAFKIEGRLKTPEYVAAITGHYRRAIDTALAGLPVEFTAGEVEEMELTFSRGFSPGWLRGCDHKMLVPATSSAKRGVRLGTVATVSRDRVAVDLVGSVKRGDGVAIDCGPTSDEAIGGRVYEVFRGGLSLTGPVAAGRVELSFAHGTIDPDRITCGQAVWKTDDPEVTSRLRKTFSGKGLARRQPVDLRIRVAVGEPVRVVAETALGTSCEVRSEEPARAALRHPLSTAVLREQLGRLGGTPFLLRDLEAEISGEPMLPLSVLGRLRHALVAALEAAATRRRVPEESRPVAAGSGWAAAPQRSDGAPRAALPVLHVLVRTVAQLRRVLELGERRIHAEFADIRGYHEAVERCRSAAATILLATPRIQKPDELGVFRALAKHRPDGMLVRNWAGLRFFRDVGLPVVADFSLNVANGMAAEFFLAAGCDRVTPSFDCNREQLLALVATSAAERLEVVIHQHIAMFHMEHCVFCAVLSPGTDKTNCGRPCDTHAVKLRDRIGIEHPLTADVGCRNTLYNATCQSGAEVVPALIKQGVRHLRIELLDEDDRETEATLTAYRKLLAGRCTGREVWTALKAANRVGVTRGTLEEKRNPLAII